MAPQQQGPCRDVRTKLKYAKEDGQRHHCYMYEQDAKPRLLGSSSFEEVTVHDARHITAQGTAPTLQKNGAEVVPFTTSLTHADFCTEEGQLLVKTKYYEEICEAVKRATGAERVLAMNHQIRNDLAAEREMEAGGGKKRWRPGAVSGYAHGIHTDTSPVSAPDLFRRYIVQLPERYRRGRFMVVNAWRNISDTEPVRRDPFAVLDCTSVTAPDDFILKDQHYEDFTVTQFNLNNANKAAHRWLYWPEMTRDELLVFKQYDSDTTAPARFVFHTAFEDAAAPPAGPARESVDVRVLAFFPDHDPDTCPAMEPAAAAPGGGGGGSEQAQAAAAAVLASLRFAKMWPAAAQGWMRAQLRRRGGMREAMETIVRHSAQKGHHNLAGADEATIGETLALLGAQEAEFERLVVEHFGRGDGAVVGLAKAAGRYLWQRAAALAIGIVVGALLARRRR